MPRFFAILVLLFASVFTAEAQEMRRFSQCQAIASTLPAAKFASLDDRSMEAAKPIAMANEAVDISYLGHSTFYMVSPQGVTIATDFSGVHVPPSLPQVVTMNHAHSTHYTLMPDPAIRYVLHGWSETPDQPVKHELLAKDTYIRNVTTDIRAFSGFEKDGNSIFIFEIAGLCIGHLGHLHHELTENHYAQIGRLDVVMVPVDGGLTMGSLSMSNVVRRLRSSLILPMHRRGTPIEDFIARFGTDFETRFSDTNKISVSLSDLPRKPTILVLKGI